MSVAISDVRVVAALARLHLAAEEEERLTGELNRILEYMEKLNELDTEGVEPSSHPVPMAQTFRPDEVDPFPSLEELLAPAPQVQDGYFKVPRIID